MLEQDFSRTIQRAQPFFSPFLFRKSINECSDFSEKVVGFPKLTRLREWNAPVGDTVVYCTAHLPEPRILSGSETLFEFSELWALFYSSRHAVRAPISSHFSTQTFATTPIHGGECPVIARKAINRADFVSTKSVDSSFRFSLLLTAKENTKWIMDIVAQASFPHCSCLLALPPTLSISPLQDW